MRIACGITTAPRKVSYLDETLASVRAAGFDQPVIVEDSDNSGSYRNFKRAVSLLLHCQPDAEAIAIFQDDIEVADGLKARLDRFGWPESAERIGVVSLYTAKPHHLNRSGWHKLPLQLSDSSESDAEIESEVRRNLISRGTEFPSTRLAEASRIHIVRKLADCTLVAVDQPGSLRWFVAYRTTDERGRNWLDISETQHWAMAYGACALLMPRESARKIVDNCTHPESRTKTDIHVAETCYRLGLSWWLHTPSFVEHRGEVSSLHEHGLNDYRRAGEFCPDVALLA